VITPNLTNPSPDGDISGGNSSSSDIDLEWWVYLLIGVGCLLAVGVLITIGIVLRLCYKKMYKPVEPVSINVSQSVLDFQKVEAGKPVEVHDLEGLQDAPTTQLYAEARAISKPNQPPRAARW
jgi:hypothetical protein